MRQLTLFDTAPSPGNATSGAASPDTAPSWESAVPPSPVHSSNRRWSLLCDPADLSHTLLAVLSVEWNEPKSGETVIIIPYTGSMIRGRDYLKDVFSPFHAELAAIARLHGIGKHRAATTIAWRGETRAIVRGPFRRQEGLARS